MIDYSINPAHLNLHVPAPNLTNLSLLTVVQATSLRLMSLSALLSYTADDSNERIFEVSAAAEILRSIISVSFAAVVADFVMAEHETLWAVVEPKVLRVVKKLREMTQTASVKAKNDATVRLKVGDLPSFS